MSLLKSLFCIPWMKRRSTDDVEDKSSLPTPPDEKMGRLSEKDQNPLSPSKDTKRQQANCCPLDKCPVPEECRRKMKEGKQRKEKEKQRREEKQRKEESKQRKAEEKQQREEEKQRKKEEKKRKAEEKWAEEDRKRGRSREARGGRSVHDQYFRLLWTGPMVHGNPYADHYSMSDSGDY
jgi:FKBP-type peptidyl-prolyl cis-trans isomerase